MSPKEAEQYVFKETLRKLNERLALEVKRHSKPYGRPHKRKKIPNSRNYLTR